ncbi:MAG: glycosyltransferase [Xylanivirga thermophila]|jgi:processive 1,2-diacylglycerol beta-glucosyltransferase|uniref:MGDG synthase family glycosyltransferase n=1 Tax=Xylanivirga thermophila TaxID=2496273 RepID=UPI0039F551A6
MRVLFLSVTAGYGHIQAAKGVMDDLKERKIECTMLDTFEYINPFLSESIAKGYLISTKFTPAVYGMFYNAADKYEYEAGENKEGENKFSLSAITQSMLSKKLTNFLADYNPDVIVCTHVFAAQIITHLKGKGLDAITIGIVTDFTFHPYWEETQMDYYVTASELLNLQARKKGIPEDKILPIGIPINKKFSKKMDKSEARKALGIRDKATILVMSGSMGYGNVVDNILQIDRLDMDLQILSVCGNNKALKEKIDELILKKTIYNFGFVDNVDLMMDASECIVTKPGGLTVSECLAKGIPMILANPIPGQEDRNVEFLLNNGLAIKTSDTYHVDEAVYQLLFNDWRLNILKQSMLKVGRPNSSSDLVNFIESLNK